MKKKKTKTESPLMQARRFVEQIDAEIPDDDDRVYIVNTEWLRGNVTRDPDLPVVCKLVPTDDPDKFICRFTVPTPKFYIKRAKIDHK